MGPRMKACAVLLLFLVTVNAKNVPCGNGTRCKKIVTNHVIPFMNNQKSDLSKFAGKNCKSDWQLCHVRQADKNQSGGNYNLFIENECNHYLQCNVVFQRKAGRNDLNFSCNEADPSQVNHSHHNK